MNATKGVVLYTDIPNANCELELIILKVPRRDFSQWD